MNISISMSPKGTNKNCSRTFTAKVILLVLVLLICLQYLMNMIIYQRNRSEMFGLLSEWHNKSSEHLQHVQHGSMKQTTTNSSLELCPIIPPTLRGRVEINTQIPAWAFIEEQNEVLKPGGRYKPSDCISRNRVAIIIPYRDREIHLKIFLQNIHPFLQRQQIDYGIYVVEMTPEVKFNRALLMNIGFAEASKYYDYQCFVFHDVDLLPEDDRNLYTCPQMPRHMSTAIDKLKYKLPYSQIFGGVSAITKEHFKQINGFSNIYFGWGGEDDDMYRRILYSNLTVTRYSLDVARYKMLVHKKETGNPERHFILRTVKARRLTDGLNSLQYKIIKTEFKRLYTWIFVSVNMTEILQNEPIHNIAKRIKPPSQKSKQVQNQKAKQVQGQKAKQLQGQKANAKQVQGQNAKQVRGQNAKQVKVVVPAITKAPVQNRGQRKALAQAPKPAAVQKTQTKLKKNAPKKLNPSFISWVPIEFKGVLPEHLKIFNIPKVQPVNLKKRQQIMAKKNPRAAQQNARVAAPGQRKLNIDANNIQNINSLGNQTKQQKNINNQQGNITTGET